MINFQIKKIIYAATDRTSYAFALNFVTAVRVLFQRKMTREKKKPRFETSQ